MSEVKLPSGDAVGIGHGRVYLRASGQVVNWEPSEALEVGLELIRAAASLAELPPTGWRCPECEAIHAPDVKQCGCRVKEEAPKCEDCRFCVSSAWGNSTLCAHPSFLMQGGNIRTIETIEVANARGTCGDCGPEGKLWEAKMSGDSAGGC